MIAEAAHFLNIKEVIAGCGAPRVLFDVMKPDVGIASRLIDGSQWQWIDPTVEFSFGRADGTSSALGDEDPFMVDGTKMWIKHYLEFRHLVLMCIVM